MPEQLRKDAVLVQMNFVANDLAKSAYEQAFAGLAKAIPKKEGSDIVEALRDLLVWHLRTHTVPGVINKSYSTIHYDKVKSMFGSKSGGDAVV